jgi:hypothetical protein
MCGLLCSHCWPALSGAEEEKYSKEDHPHCGSSLQLRMVSSSAKRGYRWYLDRFRAPYSWTRRSSQHTPVGKW